MPKGLRILHLSLGERNLTHFGGIFLIHQFCKKLRLKWYLQKQVSFHQRSSYYHPVELILAILYALIVGIHRLSKTKILQGNGAFQQIIGLTKFPYASSLRRFLKRVNPQTIQSINKVHDHLRLKMFYLPKPRTSLLFDLDSSVLTLYGKRIEGAEIGYNPHKRGARSYHPLLCFESHSRDFWHGRLRPGNVYTSSGAPEFLKECLGKIPSGIYRIRIRADSGFFDHKFIEPLDQEAIGYVIVAKMTRPIKNKIGNLRYHSFRKNWAVSEFFYQPFRWKKLHRFVVIRRPLPEKDSEQLTLFTLKRYAYHVFVTNLSLKAEKIWYFYRHRAAIEVIIRELKENYALAKIPTNNFQANQFYFHLLVFAYNLVNWFKRLCLPPRFQHATLETIRAEFLVLPARLVKTDHQNILKLPVEYIAKQTLDHIIQNIRKMKPL
jgi:Transposase DDE domain group 1